MPSPVHPSSPWPTSRPAGTSSTLPLPETIPLNQVSGKFVLHCIAWYCIAWYCIAWYCIAWYCITYIALDCIVWYCTVLYVLPCLIFYCFVLSFVLYYIVLYCTVRHYNTLNKDNFFIATCLVGTREFINIFYLLLIHVCVCKCVFYLWDLYVLYVHTSSAVFVPYNTWFNSLSDPKYYVHTFIFIFYFQSQRLRHQTSPIPSP